MNKSKKKSSKVILKTVKTFIIQMPSKGRHVKSRLCRTINNITYFTASGTMCLPNFTHIYKHTLESLYIHWIDKYKQEYDL